MVENKNREIFQILNKCLHLEYYKISLKSTRGVKMLTILLHGFDKKQHNNSQWLLHRYVHPIPKYKAWDKTDFKGPTANRFRGFLMS